MRAALAALLLLWGSTVATGAAEPPHRVSSLDLCTDELLLMLAHPADIASLSPLARDPAVSALAEAAQRYPDNRASAEIILRERADLVLGIDGIAPATVSLLRRLGVRVESLPLIDRLDQIAPAVRRVADLLGRQAQGEAVIAAMQVKLAAVPPPPARRPVALVYDANGYTVGDRTLRADALAAAGYDNLAGHLGIDGYAPLGLEQVVAHPPEIIVSERYRADEVSLAESWLAHPALKRLGARRIDVPTPLLICATPLSADAVTLLAKARAE